MGFIVKLDIVYLLRCCVFKQTSRTTLVLDCS